MGDLEFDGMEVCIILNACSAVDEGSPESVSIKKKLEENKFLLSHFTSKELIFIQNTFICVADMLGSAEPYLTKVIANKEAKENE